MGKDELAIEAEIQAKGLTAPRLTPTLIDATIVAEDFHVFPGTTLTVCALTLRNGFMVTGESASASPENFNAELGQKIARDNARNKIWALEGYLLRQRLHDGHAKEILSPQIDKLANWIMANRPDAILGEGAVDTAIAIMEAGASD